MSIRILRPRILPHFTIRPLTATTRPPTNSHQHRNSSTVPETFTATRTLPYPALTVFETITDISSYPTYIPFCTSASITSTSSPDKHYNRTWPQRATLKIGYGDTINESFTSSVFCVPPIPEKGRAGVGIVEAVSGEAKTSINKEDTEHHSVSSSEAADTAGPLAYLRSKWTIREFPYKPAPSDGSNPQMKSVENGGSEETSPEKRTDVHLALEFRFGNPVYEYMARGVAGKVAERMVDAFTKRIEEVSRGKGEGPGTRV